MWAVPAGQDVVAAGAVKATWAGGSRGSCGDWTVALCADRRLWALTWARYCQTWGEAGAVTWERR